ncbi:MAG: hypothetical protein HYT15_04965 [Candidatus Magasanikbacteria bacterium]|nr:hypothetical protein [Candidatus Magasanikbacteria bacterium]
MNTREQMFAELRKARKGSRKLRLQFKHGATGAVRELLRMSENYLAPASIEDDELLTSVGSYGDWRGNADRTITIELSQHFSGAAEDLFIARLLGSLDAIQAVE